MFFGSTSDPSPNGHFHYPKDVDKTQNETSTDKIRQYHPDLNNRPSNSISVMSDISSTSGRLLRDTVNLCVFYFYKLIGKLTTFCRLQEFSL